MESNAEKSKYNGTLLISVPESFDLKFIRNFRNAYVNSSGKYNKYIIDLKKTEFIPTCAFDILLQIHEYLSRDNSEIHLINCDHKIKQLLEIDSIDHLFHISSNQH